jgi:hypothetical protein
MTCMGWLSRCWTTNAPPSATAHRSNDARARREDLTLVPLQRACGSVIPLTRNLIIMFYSRVRCRVRARARDRLCTMHMHAPIAS